MEKFRKHRKAVWLIGITLSILTFTLGHILADYGPYYNKRYWNPEYLVISLIIIVILLGTAYFITRQKHEVNDG